MFTIYYAVPATFAEGRQVLSFGGVLESALDSMIEIISQRYTVLNWTKE